jgi:flagellar motor protein MotB
MARKERPASPVGLVPAWFVTYSDVVTLLMTFFILLMTFATNEPENFQQMQSAMFGGAGSSGIAGKNESALDRDALLVRYRPSTARQTLRGSESPLAEGPIRETVGKGVASLEQAEELASSQRLQWESPLVLWQGPDGQPTSYARQRLRMLSAQMRTQSLAVEFQVVPAAAVPFVIELALLLSREYGVPVGRAAVAHVSPAELPPRNLRIRIVQQP